MNFKRASRIIIVAAMALVAVLSVGLAMNRATDATFIERGNDYKESPALFQMEIVYEENPAFFFLDMRLIWDDTTYYVTHMSNAKRGKEIGYATDEFSTWCIYELEGYGREYLYAEESEDVWRVMSIYQAEQPWRQYTLEMQPKDRNSSVCCP